MAAPTFLMGCLPTYDVWGWWAVVVLVAVRLLQGLSVGGQLMSSLVFVAEGHDSKWWGWYGSVSVLWGVSFSLFITCIASSDQASNNMLNRLL